MPKKFTCTVCRRELLSRDEDAAAADQAAREKFGCDPAAEPERFAVLCEDCARMLFEPQLGPEPGPILKITPRSFRSRCPGCGLEDEEVDELTASPDGPRPGGFIVCPRCTAISVFNAHMELRLAGRADFQKLHTINPEGFMLLIAAKIAARDSIRERARNN